MSEPEPEGCLETIFRLGFGVMTLVSVLLILIH
jgi:hypothetical protein